MNCKNCNQLIDGSYCKHCGQSTSIGRINFSGFFDDLSDSVFQINRGFFYTVNQLFVRPGHSIREYLEGKRKNHFKPVGYVLILSTIYFFVARFLESDTFLNDFVTGFASGGNDSEPEGKPLAILKWFTGNYAYTTLMLIPVFSLASFLTFLKFEFNYLEHVVLNAYITGQQAIIYSISAILTFFFGELDLLILLTLGGSVGYALFVFLQFFLKETRISVVFRFILTYVLYVILLTLVLFLVFSISEIFSITES